MATHAPRIDLGRRDDATELHLVVEPADAGTRLDRYLTARAPWRSRTWFQRRLDGGHVSVDGRPARASQRVAAGQQIRVELGVDERPDRGGEIGDAAAFPLSILHEDEHMVLVDKPAGMVAHPVGGYRKSTLINVLHARYRRVDDPGADRVPTLINRLDRQTSGVIAVATSDAMRARAAELFADHARVTKVYLALVTGLVADDEGAWTWPLAADHGHHVRLRRTVAADGQPARTLWRVVERFPGTRAHGAATLLEVTLATGRKHQIRVHAAHAGHPIIADLIYGDLRDPTYYEGVGRAELDAALARLPIQRHALHAYRLALTHPLTQAEIRVTAPIPADFETALAALRGAEAGKRP